MAASGGGGYGPAGRTYSYVPPVNIETRMNKINTCLSKTMLFRTPLGRCCCFSLSTGCILLAMICFLLGAVPSSFVLSRLQAILAQRSTSPFVELEKRLTEHSPHLLVRSVQHMGLNLTTTFLFYYQFDVIWSTVCALVLIIIVASRNHRIAYLAFFIGAVFYIFNLLSFLACLIFYAVAWANNQPALNRVTVILLPGLLRIAIIYFPLHYYLIKVVWSLHAVFAAGGSGFERKTPKQLLALLPEETRSLTMEPDRMEAGGDAIH